MNAHVAKPIDPGQLYAALGEVLTAAGGGLVGAARDDLPKPTAPRPAATEVH
jgi:hypothetical protein